MSEEHLIELVKLYPVLYDRENEQYRDYHLRNDAWEQIAEQMKTSVEDVRNKWEKLRNCYTNALKRRRKKSNQGATDFVSWKHEKRMKFLLPQLKWRRSISNCTIKNDNEPIYNEDSPELEFLHPYIDCSIPQRSSSCTSSPSLRQTKTDSDNSLLSEMIDIFKSSHDVRRKRSLTDMDQNDYFFLSMSKQIKKLPKTDQSEIKFKLHQLIHEVEKKLFNSNENLYAPMKVDNRNN